MSDTETIEATREPRADKVETVKQIVDKLNASTAVFVTEYRGLSVAQLASVRNAVRPSDADLVPPSGRGVTLLPMAAPRSGPGEEMLDAAAATAGVTFTCEGLPDAVATVDAAAVQRVAQLLRRPHPRAAWVRSSSR